MQRYESKISISPKDSRLKDTLIFFSSGFFHFFCAFLNLGSAVIQLVIYLMKNVSGIDGSFNIFIQTLEQNDVYVSEKILSIDIILLNIIFLSIAGTFHLYYAYYNTKHKIGIKNPHPVSCDLRWVEYGIITPMIFLQISVLAGVRYILTLITLLSLEIGRADV